MSPVSVAQGERFSPPRRRPLTYPRALEFARRLVAEETRGDGRDWPPDLLERMAVKRAAQLWREYR
jgi:hypothetical protein